MCRRGGIVETPLTDILVRMKESVFKVWKNFLGWRFWSWLFSEKPLGLGTLLIGSAALVALIQTSEVIGRISDIQRKSEEISLAVSLLRQQVADSEARSFVEDNPRIKSGEATRSEVEAAIRETLIDNGRSLLSIPEDQVRATAEAVIDRSMPFEKKVELRRALLLKDAEEWDEYFQAIKKR